MNKLKIVASGKKQAGKNSTCNHIFARFLNRSSGTLQEGERFRYRVIETGQLMLDCVRQEVVERYGPNSFRTKLTDCSKTFESEELKRYESSTHGVKIYSFADPLKQFCINVFGATHEQMYGTDAQKNSPIEHLVWENIPDNMRPIVKTTTCGGRIDDVLHERKSGPMTGRDLMQIFGTDMVRRLDQNAWARATYSAIDNDGQELALVSDARFPNEIDMGTAVKAKTIRLLRAVYTEDKHLSETALDDYPLGMYTVVVDNRDMTLEETCKFLDPYIDEWFNEAGIK